jgi:predicted esterase
MQQLGATNSPLTAAIRWRSSLALALLLLLSACAAVQPRRDDPAPCAVGQACAQSMLEHGEGFRLGYIQFGDDGRYADPAQLRHVLADIEAASDAGLILVAFTHGWKEDAGAGRWSVGAFKTLLATTAAREKALAATQARAPRTVAGVFLSWPGRAATPPGLAGLTWFDREDAAERVALGDYGDALLQLKTLRDATTARQPGNQLILIGHSLGAAMLYRRLVQAPLRNPGIVREPVADLVLLLSPAIPAADAAALDRLAPADRSTLPPMLAITSDGDATLRLAFRLGQWLQDAGGTSRADRQAMGVQASQVTHRLELNGSALSLVPASRESGEGPLLQVAASQAVMRGHKDIANPNLMAFLAGVMALQLDNRYSRTALAGAFPAVSP